MLDRRRENETEHDERRPRQPEPAPPLQVGTPQWASAVGNQAVARLARQTAEEEQPEAEPDESMEPEAESEEEPVEAEAEELPE